MTALWTPPTLTGLTPGPVTLTRRRAEVLDRVCLGWVSAEIGRELFLSDDTVKTHVARMLAQFGARSRAHMAALACSGQIEVSVEAMGIPRKGDKTPNHPHSCEDRSEAAERGNAPRPLDPPSVSAYRKAGP